jgi:cation:H+ antiporter
MIAPLPMQGSLIRTELPILTVATIGAGILIMDHHLGTMDGVLLLSGLVVCLFLFKRYQQNHPSQDIPDMRLFIGLVWLVIGLIALFAGSRMLVWGATNIAAELGVSDLIIGLTIVAIGTSLPELAASIVSARKGQHAMAIGNIIGSNIFNLLAVMAIPGIIYPANIDVAALWRDYGLMLLLTLCLLGLGFHARHGGRINRPIGSLLLLVYILYLLLLYIDAQG